MLGDLSQWKAPGVRVLVSLASVVVVIAGLKEAGQLLVPIVLGFFLAFLSMPMTKFLRRYRVPGALAVLLTVLIDMLVVAVFIFVIAGLLPQFQQAVPKYVKNLQVVIGEWAEILEGKGVEGAMEAYQNLFDWGAVVELVRQTEAIQRITSMISKSFVVMIVMIFILTEAGSFRGKVIEILRLGGPNLKRFQNGTSDIQKYLGIKTLISAVTGTLAGLLTWAFGLEFALVWGLVAFFFNYIPVVGSILASIPAMFVALVTPGGGPLVALGVGIGYLLINIILGNIIEPMLLGRRFGVSTFVVVLSVLFWGWLWGPVGMFLAVPLTMIVKVMLDNTEDFRWISVAMGKSKAAMADSLAEREARALEEADDSIVGG